MSQAPSVLSKYPDYEVVIGIEVHVQLTTKTKIFCSCANEPSQKPNSNICPICTGQPGTLPVLNKQVVHYAIMAALATNSKINQVNRFARKHYFYPDLPKNFQITQNELPICVNGYVPIRLEDGSIKKINLTRIHMEEDAGKNIHAGLSNESFVDLNRTGTPLLETVTEPDISSAYEARAYLKALRSIVMYLDICSGNMEDGAFRGDTNISVRKKGATQLGTKVELKNINSFKFIGDAIEYEIERQILLLESGQKVRQETRLWDTKERKTVIMRSKEEAADYRYFDEPDLPLVTISDEWIERIRSELPELPDQKFERLCSVNKLSPYEAEILINEPELAAYYETAYTHTQSTALINWILRNLMAYLKDHKIELTEFKIKPEQLARLVTAIDKGVINNNAAQEVFAIMAETGAEPEKIIQEKGLQQMDSSEELEAIIQETIAANPAQTAQYKAGAVKLWGFFVGQVMAKSKGRANPQKVNELLKKHLA